MIDCLGHEDRMLDPAVLREAGFANRLRAVAPYSPAEREAIARYRDLAAMGRAGMFDRIVGYRS